MKSCFICGGAIPGMADPTEIVLCHACAEMFKTMSGNGWISVKDRFPEETESMFARFHATEKWDRAMWKKESEAVLVCVRFPDGGRRVTVGRTHDGEWSTSISKVLPHEVTHWMPFPEAPHDAS